MLFGCIMPHSIRMRVNLYRQRGAMLILVVFSILILALLTSSLGAMLADSSQKTTVEVRSTRALMAAQSGLEYAFYQVEKNRDGGGNMCNHIAPGGSRHELPLADNGGFMQCKVYVSCELTSQLIISEGQCGTALSGGAGTDNSSDFAVSRTLTAQAR